MGKIFGISDLPVSTIMTPFEKIQLPKPSVKKSKGWENSSIAKIILYQMHHIKIENKKNFYKSLHFFC